MAKKNAIRLHLRKTAAGDATDLLYYPDNESVQDGQRHHVTLLSFEDETSNCTETQVDIIHVAKTFRIFEQVAPAAGRTYFADDEIVLTTGERLRVYFSGATASDVLDVWLQGYWVKEAEDG